MTYKSSPSSEKKNFLAIGLLAASYLCLFGSNAHAERLRLAYTKSLYGSQVIIALEKGMFAKHSIEIEPSVFATGKLTLDAVLAGAVDLSTCAETPITAAVMSGRPIAVFARILRSAPTLLVNSESGITKISDLRGKKIGIAAGTGSEVGLYEVLRLESIKVSDVTLINLRPEDMPAAFASGSVDAINNYEPFITNARRAAGDKAKVLDTHGAYTETFNLVGMQKFAEANPKLIADTLATFIEAEAYIADHKSEAIALLSRVVGIDAAVIEQSWPNFTYRTELDPKLVSVFKAHSQWRLDTGNVPPGVTTIPNFEAIIAPGPLKSIAPERVTQ